MQSRDTSDRLWRLPLTIGVIVALVEATLVGVLSAPLRAQVRRKADTTGGQVRLTPEATDAKQFEVASIKRNFSGVRMSMNTTQPGGRYVATNVELSLLIRAAYMLDESQLIGGPGWIHTDTFDIAARAAEEIVPFAVPGLHTTANPSSGQQMLRTLLADRFKLVAHIEQREHPMYALVLARSDGKLGATMTPSTTDCSARGRSSGPPVPFNPTAPLICGMRTGPGNILAAGGVTTSELTMGLSTLVQRNVVDRTGLSGGYNVRLEWGSEADGPSLFTALQEQLGLKLESTRAPIEVVVIDSVEAPSPD